MENKKKIKEVEINISNPFQNKTFQKVIAGAVILGVTVAGTYVFANKYTMDFRSPVILQNPIVVKERLIEVRIEQKEVEEATESAQIEEKVTFAPSNRLVAHTNQNPGVYSKIVKHFGDESVKYGELISRESSLNPQAINPTSGACGLAQALPCEKLNCSLDDVDCQLEWIGDYVERRYGDIDNALAFHSSNNWY